MKNRRFYSCMFFGMILLSGMFFTFFNNSIENSIGTLPSFENGEENRLILNKVSDFSSSIINVNDPQSSSTGILDFELNQFALNDYLSKQLVIEPGVMYNFTLQNTGEAIFDIALVNNVSVFDYISQEESSEYDDELLTSCGVPMWGDYSSWNSIDLSTRVSQGITLSYGGSKSFLLYLDTEYFERKGISNETSGLNAEFVVILSSTSNPYNNSCQISWSEIDLSSPESILTYSNNSLSNNIEIAPNTINQINITTQFNSDLTKSILNETISTNESISLIQWSRDLSGNLVSSTISLNGLSENIFLPFYQNLALDGSHYPAFLINADETNNANIYWNFTEITDPTISYEEISFNDSSIEFSLAQSNIAYRMMKMPETAYFDLSFYDLNPSNQIYWDVAIDFYAIGKSNSFLFRLNSLGDNETESVTIFSTAMNNDYQNNVDSFSLNNYTTTQTWWAPQYLTNALVNDASGTLYLGMIITATPSLAYLNFTCNLDLTLHEISSYNSTEEISLGAQNGTKFGEFDLFQVRQFNFENFTQYQWELQSNNATPVQTFTKLYCNDPLLGKYPSDLNNTLTSNTIDTTGLTGTINLEFEISLDVRNSDGLYVYLKNSSGFSPAIFSFETAFSTTIVSADITGYSASDLQIVFNMTAQPPVNGDGPIIDNVRITNGSEDAFLETFEQGFGFWVQADNRDENLLYWYLSGDDQSFNNPVVDIVYPNSIYSIQGYVADPFTFSGFTKVVSGSNPFIQSGSMGYLIFQPDGQFNQNFTTNLQILEYDPVEIVDQTPLVADLSESLLNFQSGYYWEEVVAIADFYEYYMLNLSSGYQYDITLRINNSEIIIVDTSLYSKNGIDWDDNFPLFYGFFMINHTYSLIPTSNEIVFLKFDAIEPGTNITIELTKTLIEDDLPAENPPFPWLEVIVGILGLTNIITIVLVVKMKKTGTLKRDKIKISTPLSNSSPDSDK